MNTRQKKIGIMLVGPTGVGKTEVAHALFTKNTFNENYITTPGAVLNVTKFTDPSNNTDVSCVYWDTSSDEKYRSLIYTNCRNVDILLCVFDINNVASLQAAHQLALNVKDHTKDSTIVMYVGHQCGITANSHVITDEEFTSITGSNEYFEVNAKTKENIEDLRNAIQEKALEIFHQLNTETPAEELIISADGAIDDYISRHASTEEKNPLQLLLISQLELFKVQAKAVTALEDESRSGKSSKKTLIKTCKDLIVTALNPKTPYQKQQTLKDLHKLAESFSSVKKLKPISICIMAIGAILAIVGALTIAVSLGAIASGVLAPLGAIGLGGGIALTCIGVGIAGAGVGLFAARHTLGNPLNSVTKIENLIKKQGNTR